MRKVRLVRYTGIDNELHTLKVSDAVRVIYHPDYSWIDPQFEEGVAAVTGIYYHENLQTYMAELNGRRYTPINCLIPMDNLNSLTPETKQDIIDILDL